jgi:membrane protease YdiL (CAAX protease family)
MSARGGGAPFPGPSLALTLSVLAGFVAGAFALGGSVVGAAFGAVLGFGGLGFLAARRVPDPSAQRLGLTPFPARAVAPVLLLAPAVLLVSELDNWLRIAFSVPQQEALGVATLPAPEAVVLAALLVPVLEEFFFRGVLLQGSASAFGRWRAILYVAALQILLVPALVIVYAASDDPRLAVSVASHGISTFGIGIACGLLRLATGSLLPCIALSAATTSLGVAAGALAERVPIPGFNAPGATTPAIYLVPAAVSVALGVWLLTRQLAREPALPAIPPRGAEDDEEPGSLF